MGPMSRQDPPPSEDDEEAGVDPAAGDWGPASTAPGPANPDFALPERPTGNPYLGSLPVPATADGAPAGRAPRGGRAPRARRRRTAGILLITVAAALILTAVGIGGYPFYTDLQAARHQKALQALFAKEQAASGASRLKLLQEYENRQFATGGVLTRIVIPAINVDSIVVQGTSEQALAVGAGHYPQTPLPGEVGNVGIAGHRTMNGHPFADLDKLVPGNTILLETPFDTYTYRVMPAFDGHANPWIVSPTDWSVVLFPTQEKLLTLTTCNPKGQDSQRLVARAQLVSAQQA